MCCGLWAHPFSMAFTATGRMAFSVLFLPPLCLLQADGFATVFAKVRQDQRLPCYVPQAGVLKLGLVANMACMACTREFGFSMSFGLSLSFVNHTSSSWRSYHCSCELGVNRCWHHASASTTSLPSMPTMSRMWCLGGRSSNSPMCLYGPRQTHGPSTTSRSCHEHRSVFELNRVTTQVTSTTFATAPMDRLSADQEEHVSTHEPQLRSDHRRAISGLSLIHISEPTRPY